MNPTPPASTGHDRLCPAGQQHLDFPPPGRCQCDLLHAARLDSAGIDADAEFTAGFTMGLAVARGEAATTLAAAHAARDAAYDTARNDAAIAVTHELADLFTESVTARDDTQWGHRLFAAARSTPPSS